MVSGSRVARTDTELGAAARHLQYEVDMLRGSAQYLQSGKCGQLEMNAFLESFVTHARNLLHFLCPIGRVDPDDVLAEDYFTVSGEWGRVNDVTSHGALGALRSRVGKEIVHLTYSRIAMTAHTKGWDVVAILNELSEKLSAFAEHADRLAVPIRDYLRTFRALGIGAV